MPRLVSACEVITDFESYAGTAERRYEQIEKRSAWLGLLSLIAGIAALVYGSIVAGVILLVLALHWDLQTMIHHLLLVMTRQHRAMAAQRSDQRKTDD